MQAPATSSDYLRLFGLAPSWSIDDLKRAYHQKASEYHPDKNPGDKESDAKFQFVNQAYEGLCELRGHRLTPRREGNLWTENAGTQPGNTRTHDQTTMDNLAESLHSFYVSRYSKEDDIDLLSKMWIAVLLFILGFYVIANWLAHFYTR